VGALPARPAALWVLGTGGACALLYALWRGRRGLRLSDILPAALRGLLVLALVAGGAAVLLFLGPRAGQPVAELPLPPAAPAQRSPLGAPPPALLWITAALVLLASTLAAAWLLRSRSRGRRALDLLGREAEQARSALLGGQDPRSVIVACYARMSAVLAEDRGIERPGSMTAREFGELLGELGLPGPPVRELTRLFEAVRYGPGQPGPAEEARALGCLGPIVDHCRAARGA